MALNAGLLAPARSTRGMDRKNEKIRKSDNQKMTDYCVI
jgi:hypothetical protein